MRFLLWLLWLVVPRETPEGEPGEGSGEDSGEGEPVEPTKPLGGSDPEGRPDWLPEKFWNPDIKQPRAEVMAKSFTELEGKFREKTETLKQSIKDEMLAAAPEKYEVALSDDLEIPEGVEMNLSEEDPLIQWFSDFAKQRGLSQEEFNEAVNAYVGIEMKNMPDVAAEIEKLGDYGQDRLLRVHNWMQGKLSEDQFKAISPMLTSATQIEALETLMKSSGPSDFEGDSGGKPLTLQELRQMQNDKRYWQEKDPDFIAKVEEGYRRLYKGQ